jgi:hypothetical protein
MCVVPRWGSVMPDDDRNIDVGGLAAVINSRLAEKHALPERSRLGGLAEALQLRCVWPP